MSWNRWGPELLARLHPHEGSPGIVGSRISDSRHETACEKGQIGVTEIDRRKEVFAELLAISARPSGHQRCQFIDKLGHWCH